jgi:2-succinyl-6-hydroxy-2,4-cyclohexadiene-1-carboxylate synthase
MGTGVQPSLWDHLPELKLPTLLLAGALDHKFVAIARQMYDLLPQAQLQIIRSVGHMIHLEVPAKYQNLVLTFLLLSRRF